MRSHARQTPLTTARLRLFAYYDLYRPRGIFLSEGPTDTDCAATAVTLWAPMSVAGAAVAVAGGWARTIARDSVVANLVQNALKFIRAHGPIKIRAHTTGERALIDVEDECGGLPPGKTEELFRPFEQRGVDQVGLGLGLPISLRGVRASGGEIRVRDLPDSGCIFTVDVPKATTKPRFDRESFQTALRRLAATPLRRADGRAVGLGIV